MNNPNLFDLNWNGRDVLLEVERSRQLSLTDIALAVEGHAKVLIVEHDQVDTGFLVNSGYTRSRQRSTYGAVPSSGVYPGKKSGGGLRKSAPEADIPVRYDALVGFAAVYAIYQELQQSFLYRAAELVVGKVGGLVRRV